MLPIVSSTNEVPVLVERSMWWPGGFGQWRGAHNSVAARHTGTLWALAAGEVGGPHDVETYVLVGNTSAYPARIVVEAFYGALSPEGRVYDVRARSRFNIPVGEQLPGTRDRRFGLRVKSIENGGPPAEIVVEYSLYSNNSRQAGDRWQAGANALATRLR